MCSKLVREKYNGAFFINCSDESLYILLAKTWILKSSEVAVASYGSSERLLATSYIVISNLLTIMSRN